MRRARARAPAAARLLLLLVAIGACYGTVPTSPLARDAAGDALDAAGDGPAEAGAGCDGGCIAGPHATAECVAGQCVQRCSGSWGECDGDPSDGCETDTSRSAQHCGGCGHACAVACESGACTTVHAISSGYAFSCAVMNGQHSVFCWGADNAGQLGTPVPPGDTGRRTPQPVPGLTGVQELAAGGGHVCALLEDASVVCWGEDYYGQLGDGLAGPGHDREAPAPVRLGPAAPALTGVRHISSGVHHTCALTSGEVYCWGANGSGQLGDGTTVQRPWPARLDSTGVLGVFAGVHHTCAQTMQGVLCWGADEWGQLGDGAATHSVCVDPAAGPQDCSLTPVDTALPSATLLRAGHYHTCALAGLDLWCWGLNAAGQLGNGTWSNSAVPVQALTPRGLSALAAGGAHTCAADAFGDVLCWGANDQGQAAARGPGVTALATPARVEGLPTATDLAAGYAFTCALLSDQRVMCWGADDAGQLGGAVPAPGGHSAAPVAVTW
jgi:alpha-tubulin suppressor-like RCC1 family protein